MHVHKNANLKYRQELGGTGGDQNVELFVRCCEKCSSYHRSRPPKQGLLQPMIVADRVSGWSIDLSGAYPTSNNNKYILSAICPFTKFAVTEAIPDKTAATVAKVIVNKIILVHGLSQKR